MEHNVSIKISICLFLVVTASFAQQASPDFWQTFSTTSGSAFSPDNFDNWELYGFTAITTILLLGFDSEMHEEYGLEKESGPLGITKIMGKLGRNYDNPGSIYFTLGLAGSLYGTGKLFNNNEMVETTGMMMQSLVYTGLITTALKMAIGRGRPYVKNEALNFQPFNVKFDSKYLSMPSGHTSSIFALMTVIAKRYDSWFIAIPAYTFATAVGFQRMNDKQHWPSDILAGGVLGYLIADVIVNKRFSKHVSIQPIISSSGVGLAVKF